MGILLAVPRVPSAALAVLSVVLAVVASLVLGADVGFALVIGALVGVVASRQTRSGSEPSTGGTAASYNAALRVRSIGFPQAEPPPAHPSP